MAEITQKTTRIQTAEGTKISIDDLAKHSGVEKTLLERCLTAFGYKEKEITVKEFKEFLTTTGISYVDSGYWTDWSDANAIVKFLGAYDTKKKEDVKKLTELGSKLEGAMFFAMVAKESGLSNDEIYKLVSKKITYKRELQIFDGREVKTLDLTLAQHIGTAYMGLTIFGEKFEDKNVARLIDDYISSVKALLKDAKTADDVVKAIKDSAEFEALTAALALESGKIIKNNGYQNGLESSKKAIYREMNMLQAYLIAYAREINPEFEKAVAKTIDEPEERADFRRYFSYTFLMSDFLNGRADAEKVAKKVQERAGNSRSCGQRAQFARPCAELSCREGL